MVTDDHPVDGSIRDGLLDGCMWSGSSSLVSMRPVRSVSGDAVEAHAAHPHAPHMLPLKKKTTRESTASFKVNLLGLEAGGLANTVGRSIRE